MSEKCFYLTTPLYYVNDKPHIGHAYTTLAADVLARWKRLELGQTQVFFLTGTDEHGSKIAQAAEASGKNPKEYTDHIVEYYLELWKALGITHDDFIRTTETRHEKVVQAVFLKLLETSDIYKGTYSGWYCVPCETFWTEKELNEGSQCPSCQRLVEKISEETYYFKLSRYQERLSQLYRENPIFLSPSFRAREIENQVSEGLNDISVSRPRKRVSWGISVPNDSDYTIYVWFDALLNYISAPGYEQEGGKKFRERWPADVHLVGKEIFRFHSIIWPAMLMALDVPLPKKVFAHGWWTAEGQKMSKSLGNFVDPHQLINEMGVDALRFFILREVPFGSDGDFSKSVLIARYNGDLANGLGNLLSRVLTLIEKHYEGKIPEKTSVDLWGIQSVSDWVGRIRSAMDQLAFHEALTHLWEIVGILNVRLTTEAPWNLVKTDKKRAGQILSDCIGALRLLSSLLHPFMPSTSEEIWKQIGETQDIVEAGRQSLSGDFRCPLVGQRVSRGESLFPRKKLK